MWIAGPKFHPDLLGAIPSIILVNDTRPIPEQVNDRYSFGGGWHPNNAKWRIQKPRTNEEFPVLIYPAGENPYTEPEERYELVAALPHYHTQTVVFVFESAWVALVDFKANDWSDGAQISRMD